MYMTMLCIDWLMGCLWVGTVHDAQVSCFAALVARFFPDVILECDVTLFTSWNYLKLFFSPALKMDTLQSSRTICS